MKMRLWETSWASQILSNRLLASVSSIASSQAGAHDREQYGRPVLRVFEMVWQVGIEGHAVAGGELVARAVAVQHDGARLDQRGLAAARLVHRRVAGPPVTAPARACGARARRAGREAAA